MKPERVFVIPGVVEAPLFKISHEQESGRPKTALLFQEQYPPSPAIVGQLWMDHPEIVGNLYASANREFNYLISSANFDGPQELQSPKKYLEVAKFVFSHACYCLANDAKKTSPVFVAGEGISGRVNALVASQALSFEEGLKLLKLIIETGINPAPLAAEDFERDLKKIKINKAKRPVVTGLEAKARPISKPDEIKNYLIASLSGHENWENILDFLSRAEVYDRFVAGNPIKEIAGDKTKIAAVVFVTAGIGVTIGTLWRSHRQPKKEK